MTERLDYQQQEDEERRRQEEPTLENAIRMMDDDRKRQIRFWQRWNEIFQSPNDQEKHRARNT